MRSLLAALLLFAALFGADLNETLVKESNLTILSKLRSELNTSAPDYTLQKTLLDKLAASLKTTPKLPRIEAPKNAEQFVERFLEVVELLVEAQRHKNEIAALKAQLDEIEEEIEKSETNSSSYLTLNLEYAYYLRKKERLEARMRYIQAHYTRWLDEILAQLPKVKFRFDKKRYEKLLSQIEATNKAIKKYELEAERYKILGSESRLKRIQKRLEALRTQRQKLLKAALKERLAEFFSLLQANDPKAIEIKEEILKLAKLHAEDPTFIKGLQKSLDYATQKVLGARYALFLTIKSKVSAFLVQNTLFGIPLYRLAQAFGIFLLFFMLRKLFARLILGTLLRLARAAHSTTAQRILRLVDGPMKFAFVILGLSVALKVAQIESEATQRIIKSLVIFDIFWLLFNLVNILDETIYGFTRKFGKELYREIGAFFIKTLKIFIFAIGLVSILQTWDINVSAFIASLGLGGLAFALAAKDTAANLFGGLSILADRALKLDDWIKVGEVEGIVEEIGLRTTKVRTFEKSLVTVPNQYISNNPIENFSRRRVRRIKMRIGLVYSTTKQQMEQIVRDIRQMLLQHPGIAKNETLLVYFDEFGASELSIFIYCFTNTADWAKYLETREDINLRIMEIVHSRGSDFAFPSESLYIEKIPEDLKQIWKK